MIFISSIALFLQRICEIFVYITLLNESLKSCTNSLQNRLNILPFILKKINTNSMFIVQSSFILGFSSGWCLLHVPTMLSTEGRCWLNCALSRGLCNSVLLFALMQCHEKQLSGISPLSAFATWHFLCLTSDFFFFAFKYLFLLVPCGLSDALS